MKVKLMAMAALAACSAVAMPTNDEIERLSVKEAAKRLGVPANTASKIKRRIESRIFAMENRLLAPDGGMRAS